MKPRIGITMSLGTAEKPAPPNIPEGYVEAAVEAGAVPVALPPVEKKSLIPAQLAAVDGLILIGGPDYSPSLWNQKLDPATILVNPKRQEFDLALARRADRMRLPMLGICGGHQLIAVARGGSVIQDLRTSRTFPRLTCHSGARVRHRVDVAEGSALASVLGRVRLKTNSYHHQAVEKAGRNLVTVARAFDGVCEAIEDPRPRRFVIGVQWHPERMFAKDEVQLRLFRALARAAREYARRG